MLIITRNFIFQIEKSSSGQLAGNESLTRSSAWNLEIFRYSPFIGRTSSQRHLMNNYYLIQFHLLLEEYFLENNLLN